MRAQIEGEARAALPGECCGLIEGRRDGGGGRVVAVAVHPARNIGGGDDRFEIDPADHIRMLRAARARGTEIVGCYHSHPNGRAEPSARDLAGAAEEGFVWVIAASRLDQVHLRAFSYRVGTFHLLALTDGQSLPDTQDRSLGQN